MTSPNNSSTLIYVTSYRLEPTMSMIRINEYEHSHECMDCGAVAHCTSPDVDCDQRSGSDGCDCGTPTATIRLDPAELGLLKAGLAGYRVELRDAYLRGGADADLRSHAQSLIDAALALTDRLTEAQMSLTIGA